MNCNDALYRLSRAMKVDGVLYASFMFTAKANMIVMADTTLIWMRTERDELIEHAS
jgi:hypothetical protein